MHAGPEHSDQYEPDGKIVIDPLTHATVAHVDLTEDEPTVDLDPTPAVEIVEPVPMFTYRWTSERTIEGRTYRRTDRKVAEPVS